MENTIYLILGSILGFELGLVLAPRIGETASNITVISIVGFLLVLSLIGTFSKKPQKPEAAEKVMPKDAIEVLKENPNLHYDA